MKKLFFRLILISMPIIVLLSLYAKYGEWYYNLTEYPMWISKIEYVSNKHNTKDLKIILGDSKALGGFIPNEIDSNMYNLALGGGSPMEAYYQLKRLIEQNNTISTLILSFSPYHFEFHETFLERSVKYPFYNSVELNEILDYSKSLNNKFWDYGNKKYSDSYDQFAEIFQIKSAYYKAFYHYLPEFRQSIVKPRIFKNREIYDSIKVRKGNLDFGRDSSCAKLNLEATRNKAFDKNIIMELYIRKTVELAAQNNIKIYYINAPFNRASYEHINKDYVNSYNNMLDSLCGAYNNLILVNKLSFYENEFFGDASHLNPRGQLFFSGFVKRAIDSSLLIREISS